MDASYLAYASANIMKPNKAFAAAFAALTLALAGCATGLGVETADHGKANQVARVEEGAVVASRTVVAKASMQQPEFAYTIRLRSGELASIAQRSNVAIANGTPVLVEYAEQTRVIPQNASIGY